MADRAGLFNDKDDFDVSGFTPKKAAASVGVQAPPAEAVRSVSEGAFQSREVVDAVPQSIRTLRQRRRRTGRNLQLNLKASATWMETFYKISDAQRWTLGETFERAIAALQRELGAK